MTGEGVDATHPDIDDNMWVNPGEIPSNGKDDDGNNYIDDTMGWDFENDDNDPTDDYGHGTHVAGIIAAEVNNGIGIVGVAPKAKIMAVKGIGSDGYGNDSKLAKAIIYAADNGADIINLSFGGIGTCPVLEDAVDYAHSLGAVVVASAGNDSMDVKNFYPASANGTIAVAALDRYGGSITPAAFSNFGNKIDVAAPGVGILSLRAKGTKMGNILGENYTRADGTSMAAPHVAGLAALIMSKNPDFSNEDVRQILHVTSEKSTESNFFYFVGYGRMDALKAVSQSKVLEAKIISPNSGKSYTGKIPVMGYAKGDGFSKYILEMGEGNDPSEWKVIGEGTAPVDNGLLGIIDATVIPDGTYLLHLMVFDNNTPQCLYEDRLEFEVDYASISDPKPPRVPIYSKMVKTGTQLEISGNATGPSLKNYKLEWAAGENPTDSSWSAAGFKLTENGNYSVNDGVIGTWDTSAFTDGTGYCQIRLTVQNHGFSSVSKTMIYLEKDLASSNWPIQIDHQTEVCALPAKDINGNTGFILSIPQYGGLIKSPDDPDRNIYAGFKRFSLDGKEELSASYESGMYYSPAVGELGGLKGDEVVTAKDNKINILKPDNTFEELPLKEPAGGEALFWESEIMIADIDGDGNNEIIAMGKDRKLTKLKKYLYVWKSDGSLLNDNFPVIFDEPKNHYQESFLAVDLNNDNKKEFLVPDGILTSERSLKVINWDGSPGTLSFEPEGNECLFGRMRACDLDKNGQMEIIFTTTEKTAEGFLKQKIYVLDSNLCVMPGWPILADPKYNYIEGEIAAIADMDRDGKDEIIFFHQKCINILKYDGTKMSDNWPYENIFMKSLVVGDINNDNYPEIVMTKDSPNYNYSIDPGLTGEGNTLVGNNQPRIGYHEMTNYDTPELIAMDRNANIVKSWRVMSSDELKPWLKQRPVIGDFDNNGKVDILLTHLLCTPNVIWATEMTLYSLDAPYNPENMDWPMANHNTQNTSVKLSNTAALDTITIKGYIKPDFDYEDPAKILADFKIDIAETEYTAVTDQHGYFEIKNVPKRTQTYTLKISKKNYVRREISVVSDIEGDSIELSTLENPIEIWAGDMQIDGEQDDAINMSDVVNVASSFNTAKGDGGYIEDKDINMDGAINMADIIIIADHFLRTPSSYPQWK